MKKIGMRNIYFWGSIKTLPRCVYKTDDGKLVVKWYGSLIEVKQNYGFEGATNGWKTVEAY